MEITSLYIHFPFCISKCAYCDFFSKPCSQVSDSYVSALCNELSFRLNDVQKLETIYFGGGTPSLLTINQIKKICDVIFSHTSKTFLKEFTFELNPDDVTQELLDTLFKCNVTRISCGIQSVSEKVLSFANRRSSRTQVFNAIDLLKKNWKGDLSLDLISGLPYETPSSFKEALDTVINSGASHISLYSLTLEENTPLGKLFSEGKLEYDEDKASDMWLYGRDVLENAGYSQYEVSNFCKNGKIGKHNSKYWDHKSYIGCGSGATGTIYNDDGTAFRWTNTSDIKAYESAWNNDSGNKSDIENIEIISRKDSIFEFFMMGLRTIKGVSSRDYEQIFGEEIPDGFIKLAEKWKNKNLLITEENFVQDDKIIVWKLNRDGLLFLNTFLEELFDYL